MNPIRHILHVHVAAFAIAVARLSSHELRDRPVAVAPLRVGRGLIISTSSEARVKGVFKGMPIKKAQAVCPDLTLIEPDPELSEKAFRAVGNVVSFYTPVWEPAGLGHIYLDVTGTERLWGRARDTAFRIGREIETRIGLPATVGVAGNKMVSNIASRIKSNERVMDVEHGTEAAFMAPLRVSALPGIGLVRAKLLQNELAIRRIGQIAALDTLSLACLFGKDGHLIHQRAKGFDPSPVTPPEVSLTVRESHTFELDTNEDQVLFQRLHRLGETCTWRMRDRSIFPGSASIRIRYSDRVEVTRQCKLPQNGFSSFDLYPPIEVIFKKAFTRRIRIRHMEVVFRDIHPESRQLCLFQNEPQNEKVVSATQAVDLIRHRFGEEAIRFARSIPASNDTVYNQEKSLRL